MSTKKTTATHKKVSGNVKKKPLPVNEPYMSMDTGKVYTPNLKTNKPKIITTTATNKKAAKKSAAKKKVAVDEIGFDTYSHMTLGRGKATLAIRVKGEQVEVGVSFCSPKDQFSKSRGRMLAEGRLNSKRGFYYQFKRNKEHLKEQAQSKLMFLITRRPILDSLGLGGSDSYVINHTIPRWATR